MSGPPLIIYLTSTNRDKTSLRATCIAYFTIINYLGIFAFYLAGKDFSFTIEQSIYIVPFCFIALWLGNKLFPYISQKCLIDSFLLCYYSVLYILFIQLSIKGELYE